MPRRPPPTPTPSPSEPPPLDASAQKRPVSRQLFFEEVVIEEEEQVPAPGGLYGQPEQAAAGPSEAPYREPKQAPRPGGPYGEPRQAAGPTGGPCGEPEVALPWQQPGVRRRGPADADEASGGLLDEDGIQARATDLRTRLESFEQLQEPHILSEEPPVRLPAHLDQSGGTQAVLDPSKGDGQSHQGRSCFECGLS